MSKIVVTILCRRSSTQPSSVNNTYYAPTTAFSTKAYYAVTYLCVYFYSQVNIFSYQYVSHLFFGGM